MPPERQSSKDGDKAHLSTEAKSSGGGRIPGGVRIPGVPTESFCIPETFELCRRIYFSRREVVRILKSVK